MLKKSTKVALGGMVAALSIVFMFLTGILPFLTYAVPCLAGFLLVAVVIECGSQWAFLVYLAVSVLSLLLAPDKQAAMVFTFIGYYPIVKQLVEKHLGSRKLLSWGIKVLVFNVAMLVVYWLLIYVLKMPDIMTEMGSLGQYTGIITLACGNVVFIVFDIALSRVVDAYVQWFRPKFLRKLI